MISQYLVDRLKEKGFKIVSQSDDEVLIKGTYQCQNTRSWTTQEDVPLYNDREIRKFLEVNG